MSFGIFAVTLAPLMQLMSVPPELKMPPPFSRAALAVTVELPMSENVPTLSKTPPPSKVALFPVTVESLSETVPKMKAIPPPDSAEFPLTSEFVSVTTPPPPLKLKIPPPVD